MNRPRIQLNPCLHMRRGETNRLIASSEGIEPDLLKKNPYLLEPGCQYYAQDDQRHPGGFCFLYALI